MKDQTNIVGQGQHDEKPSHIGLFKLVVVFNRPYRSEPKQNVV